MTGISRWYRGLPDALTAVGFTLFPQVAVVQEAFSGGAGEGVVWAVALPAALPLAVRRLWPVPVFSVVFATACWGLSTGVGPVGFPAAAWALYAVAVAQSRPRLPAALVGGICLAIAAVLTLTGGHGFAGGAVVTHMVFALLLLGVAWAAGSAVRERREGVRREVMAAAERAKIEERLRIARDIHDVVSHSVGLIAVKASIANHVLSTRPEEAKKALAAIEEVSRGALRDLRSTLTVLRKDDAHNQTGDDSLRPAWSLADVPALVRSAEEAGVRVDLDSRFTGAVTEGVAQSAFRIVQEALANVVRHAAPTRCRMTLVTEDGVLRIEIVDEGPLPSGAAPAVGRDTGPASGAGMGLVGMAERVAAHGGTLHTGPTVYGGFEVRATLPC